MTEADLPPMTGDTKTVNDIRIGLIGTMRDVNKEKGVLAEARYREWKS